jgi:hypothetical protein
MKRLFSFRRLSALVMLALTGLSCQLSLIDFSQFNQPTPVPGTGPTATPTPVAEVTFNLALPAPLLPGDGVYLAILDEVTGLPLNPTLFQMTASDATHYTLKMPIQLGSVVKYRYIRQGSALAQEDTALGNVVRYRTHYVLGPGGANDVLTSWSDQPFSGITGSIAGVVTDASSRQPLANIMIMAGGVTTFTDTLGQYVLQGVAPGAHTLTALALDGGYTPFQQGAAVAADVTTDAPIALQPLKFVQVTFNVSVPTDTVVGAPVRLGGNLLQMGNTFGDLGGGVSVIASRMPTLTPLPDGRHTLTLRLPAGADIRYKYSLGDGFWNSEHSGEGRFVVRQFIVPPNDTVVNDTVATWSAGPSAPIVFDVTVPANTPLGDTVHIQFNPYGWTEPIPMWPMGGNRWIYKVYGPLNVLGNFGYRYCRNAQCGSADDLRTANGQVRNAATSLTPETLLDKVDTWAWYPEAEPATIVAVQVNKRAGNFWAGVEFQAGYHPSWQSLYPSAMGNVQALNANTLVLSPTWGFSSSQPLNFGLTPGADPLWADSLQAVQYSRALNFNTVVYPQARFSPNVPDFWLRAPRTPAWWDLWFQRYRAFALYHADLASQAGAQALVLGGDQFAPVLPGGVVADGSSSFVPADAEARWRAILADVRARFRGQILWAQRYENSLTPLPVFIDQFDGVYLLWSVPLGSKGSSVDVMTQEAGRRMDEELLPYLAQARKSAIIAVDYPSAGGAATGCVPAGSGGCLDWTALARPYPDQTSVTLDLKLQADLYQAVLQAINAREWVGGFIARGYYPPAQLRDKSASIHGKLAADLAWYWFPRFQGR